MEEKVLSIVKIDFDEVKTLIFDMDNALKKCDQTAHELAAEEQSLKELDYKTLKHLEQSISADIKAADESRKAFKRKWQEPQKAVEAAFNEAKSACDLVYKSYKDERVRRDNKYKEQRESCLRIEFKALLIDSGLECLLDVLPFERILETKWLNRSMNEIKAMELMTAKSAGIIKDYEVLKSTNLECPEETESHFLDTLNLRESLEFDKREAEKKRAKEKLDKQMAAAKAEREEAARKAQEDAEREAIKAEAEPEQEPVQEKSKTQAPEPVFEYTFTVRCKPSQFNQLRDVISNMDIEKVSATRRSTSSDC